MNADGGRSGRRREGVFGFRYVFFAGLLSLLWMAVMEANGLSVLDLAAAAVAEIDGLIGKTVSLVEI